MSMPFMEAMACPESCGISGVGVAAAKAEALQGQSTTDSHGGFGDFRAKVGRTAKPAASRNENRRLEMDAPVLGRQPWLGSRKA
jgi:hypothetical protein